MARRPCKFFLVARNPAVDFANTVADPGGDPRGALRDFDDLAAFLKASAGAEGNWTLRNSRDRAATFALARRIRDDLRGIFSAMASGAKVPPDSVESVNRVLAAAAGYPQLVPEKNGWKLAHVRQSKSAAGILVPIARAAAAIVSGGANAGVRKCSSPACLLFYLDKSGRRRWCSMAVCGNRAKVAAFARRHRP